MSKQRRVAPHAEAGAKRPSEFALLRRVVYYRACAQLERPGRTATLWTVVGLGLALLALAASAQSPEPRRTPGTPDERTDVAGSHLSAAEAQIAAVGAAMLARTPEQVAVAEHKTFQLLAYSATEAELKSKFGTKPEADYPLYTLVYDTTFDLRLERLAEVIVLELPITKPQPIVVMLPSERLDGSIFPTSNALAAAQIDPNATCVVQTQALRKQYRLIRDGIRRVSSRDGKPGPIVTAWWMVHDIFIDPSTKPLLLANKDNLEVFATERVEGTASPESQINALGQGGASSIY